MITKEQTRELCILIDELRLRGVHIAHFESGELKLEVHMNPLAHDELPRSQDVKERMLTDPKTTPEQIAKIKAEQDDRDLFNDSEDNEDDE